MIVTCKVPDRDAKKGSSSCNEKHLGHPGEPMRTGSRVESREFGEFREFRKVEEVGELQKQRFVEMGPVHDEGASDVVHGQRVSAGG